MEDPPQFESLSLTHVQYDPSDRLSYISAWLALAPQGLCVIYVTLIWASREIEILMMFAGQMACESLNWILKRWIKEDRPKQMFGKGYGMPSSHSQFVAYFSLSLTLFLLLRHQTTTHTSYSPSTFVERAGVSLLSLICAASVALSRIYLGYHTPRQVWVGFGAGLTFAVVWFMITTVLRTTGWYDWVLELWPARKLRVRDLILTEDLQDAGWGRFEDIRRKVQSSKPANGPKTKKNK